MEDYTNRQLSKMIEDGFKGIHKRQDKTNGNVLRNRDAITKVQLWKAKMIGSMNIVKILFIALIVPLVLHYLYTIY